MSIARTDNSITIDAALVPDFASFISGAQKPIIIDEQLAQTFPEGANRLIRHRYIPDNQDDSPILYAGHRRYGGQSQGNTCGCRGGSGGDRDGYDTDREMDEMPRRRECIRLSKSRPPSDGRYRRNKQKAIHLDDTMREYLRTLGIYS